MPETVEQYKTRILGNVEGKDPFTVQRESPSRLAALISRRPAEQLTRRPTPDKWSIAEVLAHLADAEVVAFSRYRQAIELSGSDIIPFDQDRWAELGAYAVRDPQQSLELFRLLREINVSMFERLTAEQWERYGMHRERGKESVRYYVRMMAGHDLNHIRQIEKILNAPAGASAS